MPILLILGVCLLLALIFGPSLWARWTLKRYGNERADFPGSGGELARHLLDEAGLQEVTVECLPAGRQSGGDHYDPALRAVRLSPAHHEGRSLTAVAVAAHEVGHAFQHAGGYGPLATRTRLIRNTRLIQRLGSAIIMAGPLLAIVMRSPLLTLVCVGAGILTLALEVVIHLVTLPVEFDASFGRALPVLRQGRYLDDADLPGARHILWACALTYVATSLASLLNLARWIRYLR